jgi:hypothetical protein
LRFTVGARSPAELACRPILLKVVPSKPRSRCPLTPPKSDSKNSRYFASAIELKVFALRSDVRRRSAVTVASMEISCASPQVRASSIHDFLSCGRDAVPVLGAE